MIRFQAQTCEASQRSGAHPHLSSPVTSIPRQGAPLPCHHVRVENSCWTVIVMCLYPSIMRTACTSFTCQHVVCVCVCVCARARCLMPVGFEKGFENTPHPLYLSTVSSSMTWVTQRHDIAIMTCGQSTTVVYAQSKPVCNPYSTPGKIGNMSNIGTMAGRSLCTRARRWGRVAVRGSAVQ